MNSITKSFLLAASPIVLAVCVPLAPALAQGAPAATSGAGSGTVETVTVSASRISIAGYTQPTPVTTIGIQALQSAAYPDIGNAIRQLPSLGASASPDNGVGSNDASQGDAALDTLNLRNLGVVETLVLFDGQRVVSSNLLGGGVDLSTIPHSLVERVDVVTGGASAAWGSDAVAGVVNLVLNKAFTGFKGGIQAGDATSFAHRQIQGELSWGSDFDGGRGHLILSGNYTTSPDAVFAGELPYRNGEAIVQNPAATATNGLPLAIHVFNTGNSSFTTGGLINGNVSGAGGVPNNSLNGTMFVGPNASLAPFHYGTTYGSVCYNGCTSNYLNTGTTGLSAVPYHNSTFFAYGSYKVTPNITASVQLNYGLNSEENTALIKQGNFKIYADNPYLQATGVASQLGALTYSCGNSTCEPGQYVTVGSLNYNNTGYSTGNPPDYLYSVLCGQGTDAALGQPCVQVNRSLARGVFTLEGAIGDNWSWNAYYEHSQMRERQVLHNDPLTANYNLAIDAVRVTAANVGTSGLPIGSIQCRSTLTNPTNGCEPLDILGEGVASGPAVAFVNPGDVPGGRLNQELIVLNQDVVSGSAQGVLPWGLPAGKIATAFGAEYRIEGGGVISADPGGATAAWAAGNFNTYEGEYNVKEGFLQVDVPLLKNDFVKSLNLSTAGRITDYSTSGLVETWKLGLTSQVTDDVKLRGTWSYDIRAPLISELYTPGNFNGTSCTYPPGSPSYQCYYVSKGNPNLQPEKAITISGGVVLTPHWVDGLTMSFDWYAIAIHGGIFTVNPQTEIDRCAQGAQVYCSVITTQSGAPFTPGNGTLPYYVISAPLNAAVISTSGLDFAADYDMPLFDGDLSWHLVGNYTSQSNTDRLGINYDGAGAATPGFRSIGGYDGTGLPKLRATLSATYTADAWSFTAQGRFFGSMVVTNGLEGQAGIVPLALVGGKLNSGSLLPNQIDDNSIPAVGYLDLRGSYRWGPNLVLYSAMDNVTNVPPPFGTSAAAGYDNLGRTVRLGVRFSY